MEEEIDLNEEEKRIVKEHAQIYIKNDLNRKQLAHDLAHTKMMLKKFKKGKERYAFAFFLVFIPFVFIVLVLVAG